MPYSLFRCGDDTYVVVPEAMSPPPEAVARFGPPLYLPARPVAPLSPRWQPVQRQIGSHMFAVVPDLDIDALFEWRPATVVPAAANVHSGGAPGAVPP